MTRIPPNPSHTDAAHRGYTRTHHLGTGWETADESSILLGAAVPGTGRWGALLSIVSEPPTDFTTLLVFDETAVTGGLYVWNGVDYTLVAAIPVGS